MSLVLPDSQQSFYWFSTIQCKYLYTSGVTYKFGYELNSPEIFILINMSAAKDVYSVNSTTQYFQLTRDQFYISTKTLSSVERAVIQSSSDPLKKVHK